MQRLCPVVPPSSLRPVASGAVTRSRRRERAWRGCWRRPSSTSSSITGCSAWWMKTGRRESTPSCRTAPGRSRRIRPCCTCGRPTTYSIPVCGSRRGTALWSSLRSGGRCRVKRRWICRPDVSSWMRSRLAARTVSSRCRIQGVGASGRRGVPAPLPTRAAAMIHRTHPQPASDNTPKRSAGDLSAKRVQATRATKSSTVATMASGASSGTRWLASGTTWKFAPEMRLARV